MSHASKMVLGEMSNEHRYFDATPHAEFPYACAAQTVEKDMPEEVRFLEPYDRFGLGVQQMVDAPERKVEMLPSFLAQNSGRLSKCALDDEFSVLTAVDIEALETAYAAAFASDADRGHGDRTLCRF